MNPPARSASTTGTNSSSNQSRATSSRSMYSRRSCMTRKPQASTFSASRPQSHGSDGRTRACCSASSGTRSPNSRSWSLSGRSASRSASPVPIRVRTSVT